MAERSWPAALFTSTVVFVVGGSLLIAGTKATALGWIFVAAGALCLAACSRLALPSRRKRDHGEAVAEGKVRRTGRRRLPGGRDAGLCRGTWDGGHKYRDGICLVCKAAQEV